MARHRSYRVGDRMDSFRPFWSNRQYNALAPHGTIRNAPKESDNSIEDGEIDETGADSSPYKQNLSQFPAENLSQLKQNNGMPKTQHDQVAPRAHVQQDVTVRKSDSVAELRAEALQSKGLITDSSLSSMKAERAERTVGARAALPRKRSLDELLGDSTRTAAQKSGVSGANDETNISKEAVTSREKENMQEAILDEVSRVSDDPSMDHQRSQYERIAKIREKFKHLENGKSPAKQSLSEDAENGIPTTIAQMDGQAPSKTSHSMNTGPQRYNPTAPTATVSAVTDPKNNNPCRQQIDQITMTNGTKNQQPHGQEQLRQSDDKDKVVKEQSDKSAQKSALPSSAVNTRRSGLHPDIEEWLELTGYYDMDHRTAALHQYRERKQLEAQLVSLQDRLDSINAQSGQQFGNRIATPRNVTVMPSTEGLGISPPGPPSLPMRPPKKRNASPNLTSPRELKRQEPGPGAARRSSHPRPRSVSPPSHSHSRGYDQYTPSNDGRSRAFEPRRPYQYQTWNGRGR